MEEDEDGSATPVLPGMYRWISTTKVPGGEDGTEPKMVLSFSIPVSVLSTPTTPELATQMDVEKATKQLSVSPPRCDVEGCEANRKYRLVNDFQRGACGLAHLKHLEARLVGV